MGWTWRGLDERIYHCFLFNLFKIRDILMETRLCDPAEASLRVNIYCLLGLQTLSQL